MYTLQKYYSVLCVLLHTMPTLEGELTSIYSMLDCQEFSREILFCFCFFWGGGQESCVQRNQKTQHRLTQTTLLKAYITEEQKTIF